MTYHSFNSELFRRFPRLKKTADEMFDYFEDEEPGCYLTFEDILVPEIDRAASESNVEGLRDFMNFVEEVASGDPACRNLVAIGLGEWIASSKSAETIYQAAGPMTRKAIPIPPC